MYGQHSFGGEPDVEPFGDEILRGGDRSTTDGGEPAAAALVRPARQRVELLNEQAWLRRQLADLEDLDFDDPQRS